MPPPEHADQYDKSRRAESGAKGQGARAAEGRRGIGLWLSALLSERKLTA
jgi:hypothetical protein